MTHLANNIVHFARILRASGLSIGPDRVQDALYALTLSGLDHRDDVKAALAAVLTKSIADRPIFDEAFRIFWRDPDLESKVRAMLLPQVESRAGQQKAPMANRRLAAAFFPHAAAKPVAPMGTQEIQFDAALTFSPEERLRRADFDTMTTEEWAEARKLVARLRLPMAEIATRRFVSGTRGTHLDFAASLRQSLRNGGDVWPLIRRQPRTRVPPLVVLADVSGSMERYTRMLLYFLHAISNAGSRASRVETFLFGTRLTRITRELHHRDIDQAVAKVEDRVSDWGGGTRIGPCLKSFNYEWSRRVLAQRATVLLITDGLDRDDGGVLAAEMARLKRATPQLIWLNPLLRYEGFEAKPAGVRAMLPYVDRFLPVHNIASLTELGRVLASNQRGTQHGTDRQLYASR
ncbi:MAG: VWA domain-containing protein [Betaproteobacteria bacterium]|nr:VWA domain-containing protein [Betaproteobacteria bacterium]